MPIFPQNVIGVIWDFDKTLIPGYMQAPLFARYDVDPATFWAESDGLNEYYQSRGAGMTSGDTLYLNHMLTYVRSGLMKGLNNDILRDLGGEIAFYAGMPDFLGSLTKDIESDPAYAEHQVTVEHYIVSSGLRQMILGSAVAPYVAEVWGCEFSEEIAPPGYLESGKMFSGDDREIRQIVYTIDNTSKTRAVFEINKGANRHRNIDVNSKIAHEDRRIPFQNMVYIADGPSDVPVFSVIEKNGGKTFAVYRPGSEAEFEQVNRLLEQDRIDAYGPADYTEGSQTAMWLTHSVRTIADRIVRDRSQALAERLGAPPGHLSD
ncbi:MAG: haloacid dehalogenase-like hydrolase [Acidimicrobiia bacterium]